MLQNININIYKYEFECLVSGMDSDELIILLHGFPESSYVWRKLMPDLSAKGFYCIAPNMRGYSKGARPKGRKHYFIDNLTQDILQIAQNAGKDKFHLIGHDWGAAIGWNLVSENPTKILSWTALSVPHNQSFYEAIMNDPDQKRRSKYIKLFQLPFLPEYKMRKDDFKLFRKLWNRQSEDEIENYLSIFRQKGALTSILNYYRANYKFIKKSSSAQITGDVHTPTLFIWGRKDIAVGSIAVENGHKYMKSYYKFLELDAGHWLIQSKYSEVKDAIVKHLVLNRIT